MNISVFLTNIDAAFCSSYKLAALSAELTYVNAITVKPWVLQARLHPTQANLSANCERTTETVLRNFPLPQITLKC